MQCVFIKLFLRAKCFVFYSEVACLWKMCWKWDVMFFWKLVSSSIVVYGRSPHERTFYWEFIVPFWFGFGTWAKFFWYEELRFGWITSCWLSRSKYSRFEWSSVFILCYHREVGVFLLFRFGFFLYNLQKKKIETKYLKQYPVCSFTVYTLCLWTKLCRLLHYA